MKNKLDKNAKLQSGKSKDSTSSDSKSKAKSAKPPTNTGPLDTVKKTKSALETRSSKPSMESKSNRPSPKSSKQEEANRGEKSSKSAGSAKRENPAPVSKRPAAGENAARSQAKSTADAAELTLEEFSISITKPGETKERLWRTKSFQQHPAQREYGFPDVAPELPGQYSQPTLVLMPKDPEYMFCYWELTSNLIEEKEREKLPTGNYRETLKINWESKSLFEPNFTFIPVFLWARKWYFGVPQVGQSYQVELGWLSDSGHFISIIRSNLSELPESWAATQKRLAEQGEVLAYSSLHTKTLGSSENLAVEDARSFVPEWNLSSESMSSSSWSRGGSGEAAKPSEPAPDAAKTNSRPATPKARLEVSGKVLSGTQVFVSGNAVTVDGQGYFKMEFAYNKDTLNLELVSRDGTSRSFTYDLKELVLN
ncbi:MAG: DUF4912 domain-containing protein [Fibrobacterota bacterium]|nr:DUF4912 domain-containing protein [Fibrobacterota bacterium]